MKLSNDKGAGPSCLKNPTFKEREPEEYTVLPPFPYIEGSALRLVVEGPSHFLLTRSIPSAMDQKVQITILHKKGTPS